MISTKHSRIYFNIYYYQFSFNLFKEKLGRLFEIVLLLQYQYLAALFKCQCKGLKGVGSH